MKRCDECIYRGVFNGQTEGCAYIQITGKSRLAMVYKRLKVDHITDEVRKAMDPARCRQFVRGAKRMIDDRHEIVLEGSRLPRRKPDPTVWPEAPKVGETR